ncbi:glycosyltransferase [uncultured Nocardioides sp.]|uniref:glycosyltransferase n=1 Tax=uncultured Nocardioides sp. TaxID=198441 RepID=UPI002632F6AF|nr:glycosyltransferase [uncultured Nocardioides sp.]
MGRVAVVVPAHDEEALLGRCLAAVEGARRVLTAERPGWSSVVVVALDRCRDGSAALAAAAGVATVVLDAGRVGAARAAGVAHAATLLGPPADDVWIAGTDADTVVGPDWLVTQVDVAAAGGELVVGRVVPDAADVTPALLHAWGLRHASTAVAAHVHGANLGFSLAAYRRVGGFGPGDEHEDRGLVAALLAAGTPAHPGAPVVTSGRRTGRTPGGFAGYLRRLDEAALPGAPTEHPPHSDW